jgi:hypothetical protein
MEDNESFITKALREYVMKNGGLGGTDNRQYDVAMNVDSSSGTAKGYADGGMVDAGDSMPYKDEPGAQDATVPDFLLPLLLGRLPMGQAASAPAPALRAAPAMGDVAGSELREAMLRSMELPAKGYAAGGVVTNDLGAVPMPTEPPLPPAPPAAPTLPSIMNNAQSLGRQLYGQYTPDARNQLYSAIAERQTSMPFGIGAGLANVGDAIARGYGGSQTNYLDKTLQSQKDARSEALGAFDTAQKENLGMTQSGMELGKMVPGTDLSKLAQQAYSGPLKKLGYTDEQISKMPANQIEAVAQVALKYADVHSQEELKKATLELQSMIGNANIMNRRQELELAKVKAAQEEQEKRAARQGDAAKALVNRGAVQRVSDFVTGNPATKVLQEQAAGGDAPVKVNSTAEYNALPAGAVYIDSLGKRAIKK